MIFLKVFLPEVKAYGFSGFVIFFLVVMGTFAGEARGAQTQAPPSQAPSAQTQGQATPPQGLVWHYDKAIFLKPMPNDQLIFLNQFAGQPSKDLFRDKQFRKLMKNFVPDCMYHYGSDMPLDDALDRVFSDSRVPVLIRDNRYVLLVGDKGPY